MSRYTCFFIAVCITLAVAGTVHAATVAKPSFNQPHGFYSSGMNVTITSSTSGATIRYTTDASKPTTTHGTVLANGASVWINKTTCLRACAAKDGMTTSTSFTQTYIFLDDRLTQTRPSSFPVNWPKEDGTSIQGDYNMDSAIVNNWRYSGTIKNDLKSIPSISVVMPTIELFGSDSGTVGVYRFGGYHGNENTREEECSAELIYPGRSGFQINCGFKGHSGCPHKRSFRLLFKSNYGGTTKLEYPFFQDAPLDSSSALSSFGKLFFRHGNNEAWTSSWRTPQSLKDSTYIHDGWQRHSFVATSGPGAPRNMLVHVYLNGLYWGVYDACERPDARFAADYIGGVKTDWYAANMSGSISGNATRYNYLHNTLVPSGGFSNASKYNTVKQYLDVQRYADYIIVQWLGGAQDWPANNFYAVNRNNPAGPVQYMMWDSDLAWRNADRNGGQDGAWVCPWFYDTSIDSWRGNGRIAKLWRAIDDNTDFLMLFADRVYKHCANGGALTDANSQSRWDALAAHAERAMVGESARWGDHLKTHKGRTDVPTFTQYDHWRVGKNKTRTAMSGNAARFISALRGNSYKRLYPSLDPPLYSKHGGSVSAGYQLSITRNNSTGTIFYRTDGQDPRVDGGTVRSGSSSGTTTQVVVLNSTTTVKARVKNSATWSALANATFTVSGPTVPAAPSGLTANAQSTTQIQLTWTDNSSNEDGFKVERSATGSSGWAQIATVGAGVATYTDGGLTASTKYYYRVRAYNSAGNSGYSNEANATTDDPAAEPAIAVSTTAISVGCALGENADSETFQVWNSGTGTLLYKIVEASSWFSIAPTTESSTGSDDKETHTITFTTSDKPTGTHYRAFTVEDDGSGADNGPITVDLTITIAETPPAAPSNLQATALSTSQIQLTWQDNSDDEDGFRVRRSTDGVNFAEVTVTAANATSYTDSGLTASTLYYYKVKATGAAGGSDYSNTDTATTQDPAPEPEIAVSRTSIAVSFEQGQNASNETFQVWNGGSGTLLYELVEASSWFSITPTSDSSTGSTDKQTHTIQFTTSDKAAGTYTRTFTVEDNGSGAINGPITVTIYFTIFETAPNPPSNLQATALSSSEIGLTWQDNSDNEDGFRVRRSADGVNFAEIVVTAADATSYTDSGLAASTKFYYRVKATGPAGGSTYSADAWATTLDPPALEPEISVNTTSFWASCDQGQNAADQTFQVWNTGTGTLLYRIVEESSLFTVTPTNESSSSSADIKTHTLSFATAALNPGTYQRSFTVEDNGSGAINGPITMNIQITVNQTIPAAPSDLTAVVLSATEIQLSWTDNSNNEDGFRVRRSLDGNDFYTEEPIVLGPNVTNCVDSDLTPDTKYYYRVKATGNNGSDYSNTADATTLASGPVVTLFTAYNDLCWVDAEPETNITKLSGADGAKNGELVDYATGNPTGIRLTVDSAMQVTDQGANPDTATPAADVFEGIVGSEGLLTAGDVVLTLDGLDSSNRYEVTLFGNRGVSGYTNRTAMFTIGGAYSFSNSSSAGATILTQGMPNDTTELCTGYNTVDGLVAQFSTIDAGGDRRITITVSSETGGRYVNALRVKALAGSTLPATAEGMAKSGTWKYRPGTSEADTGWQAPGYDDSAWSTGAAPFGYGPLDYGTVLSMQGNYVSVFLRRAFTLTEPSAVSHLQLDVDYDDGFIVWVNGREMARVNVGGASGSDVDYDAICPGYVSGSIAPWTGVFKGMELPPLGSNNVVAVQQFNNTLWSGDALLDLGISVARTEFTVGEDSDQNRLPDDWETDKLSGPGTDPYGDQDLDGQLNIDEFGAGTDPDSDTSYFAVEVVNTNGQVQVRIPTIAATGPGYTGYTRYYALEARPAFDVGSVWQTVPACTRLEGDGNPIVYEPPVGDAIMLYRGRVWLEK